MSSDLEKKDAGFFLIKSIRQYPDPYAFWRFEAMSLTLTDDSPEYEKTRPLRFGGEKKQYTLRTDGPQEVKKNPLYKKYDENQKRWDYSKHKSLTAVKEEGFSPPAFSFNKLNKQADPDSVEVGYMLPAMPAYALPRRILQGTGGTIHRNFRYETEEEAKKAWDQGLNKTIFSTLDDLAQYGNPEEFNEVMAHVKWGPEARIAYFKDNLPSKLRAISLAHDMSVRLHAQQIKNKDGEDSKSIVPDVKELPHVPIYSYLPKEGNKEADMEPYGDQEKDIKAGLESKELNTRAFARFVQLQRNDFVKNKEDDYSAEELEIFIKIAADLTYDSSILFFQNFYKNETSIFKELLDKKPHLLRDIFRCVPLDKRPELIYPLLTTHQAHGYYLHGLLKFDFLDHDIEEFFKQLESCEKIDFEVVGEYKPENLQWKIVDVLDRNGNTPLHLAAARDKAKAVDRLLRNKAYINAKNKDNKTPLDLAFEAGHLDMVKFLRERGGNFNPQHNNLAAFLHLAVKQNDYELVKLLIEEYRLEIVHMQDKDGLSALYHAIFHNNSKIVELLIEKGAWLNTSWSSPLSYAISNNRLEMAKLLIKKGADVNAPSFSQKPLDSAVRENKLVAVDLLLGYGGTYNHDTDRMNSLAQAIEKKNWEVIDFLLVSKGISFFSPVSDSDKYINAVCLITTIAIGTGFAVYKNINPSIPQEFSGLVEVLGAITISIFGALTLIYLVNDMVRFFRAKKGYDEVRKRVEDKKIALGKTESLRALGVNEPSVEGVIQHFNSLSLSLTQQATQLIQIAKVDPELSLYVIIRMFNSNIERASHTLWVMSDLSEISPKEFCNLFENPRSDELEVIVGCVTQKLREINIEEAFGILNMFSSATKEKIIERLDPIHKSHFTPQNSPVSDQKLRMNVDTTEVKDRKQYSPTSSALNRDTFFYHDDLDVKKSDPVSQPVIALAVAMTEFGHL